MPLNNLQCRNAKAAAKRYRLYDRDALYLEIMPNGSKSWFYKYRFLGKEKRLALGLYPVISLINARKLRDEADSQRNKGYDPALLRAENKRKIRVESTETFEAIALEWWQVNYNQWTVGYAAEKKRRLEKKLFPVFGKYPIRQVTTPMVYDCLKAIEAKAPEIAKSMRSDFGNIMRFAVQTGRADKDVSPELAGCIHSQAVKHHPAIDTDELPKFLATVQTARKKGIIEPISALAIKLMLLTFVRRSELMGAEWSEFDLKTGIWIVPGTRMKRKLEHIVPLSKQAIQTLQELLEHGLGSRFLFPSVHCSEKRMDKKLISKTLLKIGYQGRMCCHGFRALAMGIIKEKLDYRHEIPDRQLAHVPQSEITRAYDRAKYLTQRTEMMQKYADYIDQLTQPKSITLTQRIMLNERQTHTGYILKASASIRFAQSERKHIPQGNESRAFS